MTVFRFTAGLGTLLRPEASRLPSTDEPSNWRYSDSVQNDILSPAENAKLFAVFPWKSTNVASLKSNLPM